MLLRRKTTTSSSSLTCQSSLPTILFLPRAMVLNALSSTSASTTTVSHFAMQLRDRNEGNCRKIVCAASSAAFRSLSWTKLVTFCRADSCFGAALLLLIFVVKWFWLCKSFVNFAPLKYFIYRQVFKLSWRVAQHEAKRFALGFNWSRLRNYERCGLALLSWML